MRLPWLQTVACILASILLVGDSYAAPDLKPSNKPAADVPRYEVERIDITGNSKTRDYVIRREILVKAGERLSVDDPRFELTRYRILSLGYFASVDLRLKRGSKRGKVRLIVEVKERGTLILTDIFLGTSEATAGWGGLGLAERNFLGRGIGLELAFVLGSDPDVERGDLQQAYYARLSVPRIGDGALRLDASFRFTTGSEFFRRSGLESTSDPKNFLSAPYRRLGGSVGLGFDFGEHMRLHLQYRGESISADLPDGAVRVKPEGFAEPIRFKILDGASVLSLASIRFDRDTRSDPILPVSGSILTLAADVAAGLFGSSYDYVKLTVRYRRFWALKWGHVVSLGAFGGAIFGDAPFFERFFVGDLNDLMPSRALGVNFSTLPSRDVFGTAIDDKRYEDIAIRTSLEYIVPWFRGGKFFYRGDFFLNFGVIFLASREDLAVRDRPISEVLPADLTIDAGLRLDSKIGVFRLSIGNALGRIPF